MSALGHVWTAPWQELSSRLQPWSVHPCFRPVRAAHPRPLAIMPSADQVPARYKTLQSLCPLYPQKRTFAVHQPMSALPGSDIKCDIWNAHYGPIADIGTTTGVQERDAATRGKVTLISVNSPGRVSTSIEPPCCFTTMSWLMERPRPVPSPAGFVVKEGLNIFSFTSAEMPVPLSRMLICTRSPRFLVKAARVGT